MSSASGVEETWSRHSFWFDNSQPLPRLLRPKLWSTFRTVLKARSQNVIEVERSGFWIWGSSRMTSQVPVIAFLKASKVPSSILKSICQCSSGVSGIHG